MLYIEHSGNFPLNIIANNFIVLSTDSYSVLVQGRFATKGQISNLVSFALSKKKNLSLKYSLAAILCHNIRFI